jgi:hypothetical protein
MIDATSVDPMPEQTGDELLDELRSTLCKYVVFPDRHTSAAVALWVAVTHVLPAFEVAPRLIINSPAWRCGKSRLLDVIEGTCHDPLSTVNASTAALYRSLGDGDDHPPTILQDEADAIFGSKKSAENHEDLRALYNAGHQRGRTVLRCVGPRQDARRFNTFAMVALAGIGTMPHTITDRAVNIAMRRRARDERVSQFRSRRDGPILASLRARLADWASTAINELKDAEPEMPVEDRAADTWEPLIAVADAAGGHWPDTAREACVVLVSAADEDEEQHSHNLRLIGDIRDIFDQRRASFLSSADLVEGLRAVEESPWADFDLNTSKLAYRLREFKVKPGHAASGRVRGYRLDAFHEVFRRYPRQKSSEGQSTQSEQEKTSDGQEASDGSTCQTDLPVRRETAVQELCSDDLTTPDGRGNKNAPRCLHCHRKLVVDIHVNRGYCDKATCVEAAASEQPR